jgi:hypothetical protein
MAHVTASLSRLHELPLAVEINPRIRTSTPPNATTDAGTSDAEAPASGTSDFQSLFNSQINSQSTNTPAATTTPAPSTTTAAPSTATPATSAATDPPTPESVFGASPWVSDPTGTAPDGSTINFNPWYFATPQAAAQVAQMLGGTVVASNEFCGTGGPAIVH